MPYQLENFVNDIPFIKDWSVKTAVKRALRDDRALSYAEVKRILFSSLDGEGVTDQEYRDLQAVLRYSTTLDARSRALMKRFLDKPYYYYQLLQKARGAQAAAAKKTFDLPYVVKHIPASLKIRRPGLAMSPLHLTIHGTANLHSTAMNERDNMARAGNTRQASFHLVVDQKEAIECIPLSEVALHAGDGGNGTGNRNSIGMEICESGDRKKTLDNAISLAAKVLRDKKWDSTALKIHKDWSGKNCPRILIDSAHRKDPSQTWA
ncbi:MAG: N-acetylmuramoyl-L-alanine amidase, partial [Verrucomicrobiota bacterium]